MINLFPSVLALVEGKDYSDSEIKEELSKGVELIPSAPGLHIDVMDGKFVKQKTPFIDPIFTEHLYDITEKFLDVHLMVADPENYFADFARAGANLITFHYEASDNPASLLHKIKSMRTRDDTGFVRSGIVLNPDTKISDVPLEVYEIADWILLMAVYPGECNQKFIEGTVDKLYELNTLLESNGLRKTKQVDGGVKVENAYKLINAAGMTEGGLSLVSGSGVFGKKGEEDSIVQKIIDPILIGADHGGVDLKQKIIDYFVTNGIPYYNFGTDSTESCDHPAIAESVASRISKEEYSRGVLICGTGQGMLIGANRFKRVRATPLYTPDIGDKLDIAKLTREHNDSNIAVFGARVMDHDLALLKLDAWMNTACKGGKYSRRNNMFDNYKS